MVQGRAGERARGEISTDSVQAGDARKETERTTAEEMEERLDHDLMLLLYTEL